MLFRLPPSKMLHDKQDLHSQYKQCKPEKHCVEYLVSVLHQFTVTQQCGKPATPTIITKQKFHDTRSQIDLEKSRTQFWACGLDDPKPE
jgi:hypothetical protein